MTSNVWIFKRFQPAPTTLLYALACIMVAAVTILVAMPASHGTMGASLAPQNEHARATKLITYFLRKNHYKNFNLDNSLSDKILDAYVETLDGGRSYFYQQDIDDFQVFRFKLDDALNGAELKPPFQMFQLYQTRVDERVAHALRLLNSKFDFTVDEELVIDRSNHSWAVNNKELNEIWRKRVKNDVLTLKLAGKQPDEIKETLTRRYKGIAKRSRQVDAEDVYQLFVNAFTSTLEPHTNYLSPRDSDNFAIRMSLSLEGIGALLRTDGDYTLVERIIPGGPAEVSDLLHASDRIVGIAQQHETEFKDVVGWRLDDVVRLIRGTKGSIVKLQILPGTEGQAARIKEIRITRDKIKLEEQAAKSEVIEISDEHGVYKIGVIDIPAFYIDFAAYQRGESDYRSTTRDVDALITKLKSADIEALVLDLRGNGGGSLTEATQLMGLFIDAGPIVQVRDAHGRIEIHRDRDMDISYQGPLVVLVDRFSASASEIVASAIQDYQLGIVVGETTFGKGTVQQLVDLNHFNASRKATLGQLKATIAQYFRINGSSTQHRGVTPNIDFHTIPAGEEYGERALQNALPWSSIAPVTHHYGAVNARIIQQALNMHKSRVQTDDKFNSLLQNTQLDFELSNQTSISLFEAARRKEYDRVESIRAANSRVLTNTENNLNTLDNEAAYIDVLLDETVYIATDLVRLLQSQSSGLLVERDY